MTTIEDLRDALRIELHDENADRWQDDVLDRHLQRAARELAFVWPREQRSVLATTAGSRELSLASLDGLIRVLAVEYPVSQYPASFVPFSVLAEVVTLLIDPAPAGVVDVAVYWGSLHTLDTMSSTLPAAAEEAVVTGAAGFAAIEWASFATNRANVSGSTAVEDYLRWGDRQLTRFQAMLARFGNNGRLRTGSIVPSVAEAASRAVVRW